MGIFNFLSEGEIDKYAERLAEKLSKKYPPELDNNPRKRVSDKRLSRQLEELAGEAKEYAMANRIGWYKKARFGNSFRWALKEKGYRQEFVDVATEALIVYITKK